jgi:hypothetical protein
MLAWHQYCCHDHVWVPYGSKGRTSQQVALEYGYLLKLKHASIRVRTAEPDYSGLPDNTYDWTYTDYGKAKELQQPLGKYVTLSHNVDANLMHGVILGRFVTGVFHIVNKIHI